MTLKRPLKQILVIDDDDEYNFLTGETFNDSALQCFLVFKEKAQDALDYLADTDQFPDLIFLDINMPIMNGWEFLQEYQKRNYHFLFPTVIVMTSSSVYEEDEQKARAFSPVVEYIEKPLALADINRISSLYFAS